MKFSIDYLWTPIIVFVLGYLFVRMAGKKSVSQMNSFDLMVIMIIGTTVSEPIVSKNNWIASWYSLIIVLCFMALSRLVLVNKFKTWLTSSPTVLIQDGKIDRKGLKKAKMHVDLLLGTLRVKGYTSIDDVEIVIMEESGQISVIPKSDKRPLQPNDIQMSPSPAFVSIPLIVDGEVVNHNLKFLKKNVEWLYEKMQANNLNKSEINLVTLATYNQQGIVKFDTNRQDEYDKGTYSHNRGNEY